MLLEDVLWAGGREVAGQVRVEAFIGVAELGQHPSHYCSVQQVHGFLPRMEPMLKMFKGCR
ncbi:hypothetical protein D7V97_22855 [Corallococcus sp. CA053C]|nr:hypothetical protein D7V97_22855 [Corallococcus sp. CA053C]